MNALCKFVLVHRFIRIQRKSSTFKNCELFSFEFILYMIISPPVLQQLFFKIQGNRQEKKRKRAMNRKEKNIIKDIRIQFFKRGAISHNMNALRRKIWL